MPTRLLFVEKWADFGKRGLEMQLFCMKKIRLKLWWEGQVGTQKRVGLWKCYLRRK